MDLPRVRRLLIGLATLLAAGLGYAAFVSATGLFVPCPFRALTGFLCPGCGVSHLCLALLHLDLHAAWAANPGLMLALPPLAVLGARLVWRYLRGTLPAPRGWENALLWAVIAWLAVWGVLRNLPI